MKALRVFLVPVAVVALALMALLSVLGMAWEMIFGMKEPTIDE